MSRTSYRLVLAALALATFVSFAPILSVVVAGLIANRLGCALDEGSVHPCLFRGTDIGHELYTAFVLGWFALITWPGMLLSIGAWIVVAIRAAVVAWRRRHGGDVAVP